VTVPTADKWRVFYEIGALTRHPEPADFANAMIRPPCTHHGPRFLDDGPCPPPCGQQHWFCTNCLRPTSPPCPVLDDGE
jgi:hypothetical protein